MTFRVFPFFRVRVFPFFRVLVAIEPGRSLLQFVTTNCLKTLFHLFYIISTNSGLMEYRPVTYCKKVKMKYFKKVCLHDNVTVALNVRKD